MRRLLAAGLLLFSLGLAQSVPLTRYFPDNALATLELNDLQGALNQTGQFGEETLRALTQLAGTGLQSLAEDLAQETGVGALSNLGVRALAGAVRDATVALYSDSRSAEPLFLAVARVGQFGVIGQLARSGFAESLRNPRTPRLREGNFLAIREDELWAGYQDGLLYLSNSPDLLRGYLRRVRGQNLPVLTAGTAYKAVMDGVGPGWARYFVNLGGLARWGARSPEARGVPPRFFAALRTLNLHGAAQRLTAAGVESRSLSILNPSGGDAELYRLLTHSPQRLELTALLPAQSSGTALFSLDAAGWLDYLASWAELAEVEDAQQFRQTLAELKNYLGNEYGVTTTGNGLRALAGSAMNTSTLAGLSGDPTTAFISSLTSGLNANILYAQVKDGPAALGAIEQGLRRQLGGLETPGGNTRQTLERLELGGSPALHLNTRFSSGGGSTRGGGEVEDGGPRQNFSLDFYVVARGNVLWLGSNQAELEAALAAPVLGLDPTFSAQRWPQRPTGLNFALPLRLSPQDATALINTLLEPLGAEAAEGIPQNLRQIVEGWLVNWSNRTGVTTGHATVVGNRLSTYGLSEFRWNR